MKTNPKFNIISLNIDFPLAEGKVFKKRETAKSGSNPSKFYHTKEIWKNENLKIQQSFKSLVINKIT